MKRERGSRSRSVAAKPANEGSRQTTRAQRGFALVPLTREESHHLTVEASLAGKPALFILDTGAGGTILDSAALAPYGLRLRKGSQEGGGVGPSAAPIHYVGGEHRLRLGAADLSKVRLQTMDLSVVNSMRKRKGKGPVAGILGGDVLWPRQAVIDYGKAVLLIAV